MYKLHGAHAFTISNIPTFTKNSPLKVSDIVLILLSSAGLLHGILFAFYLIVFKKKKRLSNLLLGLILICMAFRIGKSVLLNFGDNLEPIFIFLGLAFLLVIGPLLRWYVLSMLQPNFTLPKQYLVEFIPFALVVLPSLFVTKTWFENSKWVIIVFSSGLIFIYLHLLLYIVLTWRAFDFAKRKYTQRSPTKSQKAVFNWLHFLLIGYSIIWGSYVLNILDDTVPYVIGPIMYSVVIYYLSYKAFQLKTVDLNGDVFKDNTNGIVFDTVVALLVSEKLFLETDLSLPTLSRRLGKSTQQISSAINQYAKRNFNDFVNHYRIEHAKRLLSDPKSDRYTISSIAFDVGFNSLSSFNSAFRKFEGITPSNFRENRKEG